MKISYKWLRNYVETAHTPEKLAEILTDTGLEVEGLEKIESIKGGLKGVVIGKVLTCEKHENADKLNVTTVDVGAEKPLQIVCGAPNVAVNQKVVVATVGTTLYPSPEEPFNIKKSKIRGVESEGMICAEDELGIGQSHAGIMVLEDDAEIGMAASTYFNLADDYRIEIGLTPNRSDAMGHIGVARDIIAYANIHERGEYLLKLPDVSNFKLDNESAVVKVNVEDVQKAPRYMGVTISELQVKPSPDWLKNALLAIGLTPINNVVDVTNYVLHELGTPLHAFDLESTNGQIVVRTARDGEELTTLDDVKRKLTENDLVISNGEDALCLAGVFGGLNSGVTAATTAIFLESAYFDPVSIRKTAKYHGLNTDASFRFERGVDVDRIDYALKRAALLIQEVAGGKISMPLADHYPAVIEKKTVEFSFQRCNDLIGNDLPKELVKSILANLDINIIAERGDTVMLEVPNYRVDVTREADVIEEVLRIYGFNNITLPEKLKVSITSASNRLIEKSQLIIADFLAANGLSEMMNNSLTSSIYVQKFGGEVLNEEHNVSMLNPLSNELDAMRQTLLFQSLESYSHNQNRQHSDAKLFEFGKTYRQFNDDYQENKRLLILMAGRKFPEQWNTPTDKVSFYTVKGMVNGLLERLGLAHLVQYKPIKKSLLADGVQLTINKRKLGEIGWVTPKMKKHFGIKNEVFIADLDWDVILDSLKMNKIKFKELPKTFAVRRDYSLLLANEVGFADIEFIASQVDRKILREVNLFDVYEGDKLPEGKKSYAVSFSFQDDEQTLKDDQVDKVMEKIRNQLEQKLNAELR